MTHPSQSFPSSRGTRKHALRRKGSVLVLVALSLVIVLAGVAMSVDVAFVQVAQTEVKAVSDLAAMSAVEALTRTQDVNQAILAAKNTASAHSVAGANFQLATSDIVLGRHKVNGAKLEFEAGTTPYTAVQITGRLQNSSANAPIRSFFAQNFNVGEFEIAKSSVAAQLDRDIALVLDISTSMSDDDRFEDMIDAAHAFVDEIEITNEVERVMIISYNHSAYTNHWLTENPNDMRDAIDDLEIDESGTAIGEGLLRATDNLFNDPQRRPLAQPVIIVMTDGNHNTGIEPSDAVITAAARQHVVNTITFSSDANEADMIAVANSGNGIHVHADDGDDLIDAFRYMAQSFAIQLTE